VARQSPRISDENTDRRDDEQFPLQIVVLYFDHKGDSQTEKGQRMQSNKRVDETLGTRSPFSAFVRRSYFAISILVASLAFTHAQAQTSAQTQAKPVRFSDADIATANALIKKAQSSDLGYELVASLTTEVGARPAGSDGDRKAVAWSVAKLKALGFDRVWTDPVRVSAWKRVGSHADLVAPYHQHIVSAALGNSISTPPQGIEAEIAYYETFDALKQDTSDRAKGKIVYIDSVFPKSRDGKFYGPAVGARINGAVEASKRGALAVVIRSISTSNDRFAHTGTMRYDEKIAPMIPAAAISASDGDLIRRIATTRKETDAPMKMFLNMKNITTPNVESFNVLAEIRGSDKDPVIANEVIAIGGHLDSWDMGTGALDDGAGVAITAAAAALIRDMKLKPRRTIRVIFFANEENGFEGARDYAARYGKEKHQLVSESDFGAGNVYRLDTRVDEATRPWLEAIHKIIAPLGIEMGGNTASGGPDFGPMVAASGGLGHPAVGLAQDGTDYFDYHHTANDTLDKIDPVKMKQNVAAWIATVWLAAQADVSFKGLPAPVATPR
jgi:carboxypeptidase Q